MSATGRPDSSASSVGSQVPVTLPASPQPGNQLAENLKVQEPGGRQSPPPSASRESSLADTTGSSSVSSSTLSSASSPDATQPLPQFPHPPTTLPQINSPPLGLVPMTGSGVQATQITVPLEPKAAPVSFLEEAARPLDKALPTKADKVVAAILGLPGTIIGGIAGFLVGLVTGPFSKVGMLQSMKDGALCGAKWGSVVSPPFLGSLYTGIRFLYHFIKHTDLLSTPKLP